MYKGYETEEIIFTSQKTLISRAIPVTICQDYLPSTQMYCPPRTFIVPCMNCSSPFWVFVTHCISRLGPWQDERYTDMYMLVTS